MKSSFIFFLGFFLCLQVNYANASFNSSLSLNSQALINLVRNLRSMTQACLSSSACGLEKNEADLLLEMISASEAKEFIFEFQPPATCSSHDFSFLKWSVCEPLLNDYDSDHNSVLSASEAFYFIAPQFERGTRGVSLVASGLAAKVTKILSQIQFESFVEPSDLGLYFVARTSQVEANTGPIVQAELWAEEYHALNVSQNLLAGKDCSVISWETPVATRMESKVENTQRYQLLFGQKQLCKGQEEAIRIEKSLTLVFNSNSREIQLETP